MRILHVAGYLDFADGGPPVLASHLAAGQAELGHNVSIAFYRSLDEARTRQQLAAIPSWDRIQTHIFPRPGRFERIFGRDSATRLRPLVTESDVIHIHGVWESMLLRAAIAAWDLGKPYLIVANGMLDPWSLSQKKWKKRLALALGYRKMLDRAAALHLLNDQERDLIAPLGLAAPAAIIPNGVTLEEIDPLPPRGQFISSRLELTGKRFILFLSRVHYKKGLDFLADAFARLAGKFPDLDLLVAGPDGGERANFQNRVAVAGLSERVHIVGPLYGPEKFSTMVDCDCFVLPSRQEGFSIAVLEAMACEAPVVISDACHFPEVATAGAGEVVPLNAAALAAALERILTNPDRRKLGQAGRALVISRYTWKSVAEQTISVYETLLKLRAGRG